jgi:hypothetical protein
MKEMIRDQDQPLESRRELEDEEGSEMNGFGMGK